MQQRPRLSQLGWLDGVHLLEEREVAVHDRAHHFLVLSLDVDGVVTAFN